MYYTFNVPMVRMENGITEINFLACGYTRSQLQGYRTSVRNLKSPFGVSSQEHRTAVGINVQFLMQEKCGIRLFLLAGTSRCIFLLRPTPDGAHVPKHLHENGSLR